MSTVKRGLRTRTLLPPAHSETAKRGRDQTYGSTEFLRNSRSTLLDVSCCQPALQHPGSNSSAPEMADGNQLPMLSIAGLRTLPLLKDLCAARLAAPKQRDAVSFSSAFTIVCCHHGVAEYTFNQTRCHPMTHSSKNGFIQKITYNQYSPCLCENVTFTETRLVPAFRVSTGFHVKHHQPKAGNASPERLLKVERREFKCLGVQVFLVFWCFQGWDETSFFFPHRQTDNASSHESQTSRKELRATCPDQHV